MKKESIGGNTSQNVFVGICKDCGEVYEARSGLEDLEGVTFQCKKLLCEGKVSLESSAERDRYENHDNRPKRFC